MKSKLKRIGWLSLAALFALTGLGIGIYGFWQATHPPDETPAGQEAINIKCSNDPAIVELKPGEAKLAGTKLPNFTPVEQVTKLTCIDGAVGSGPAATSSSNIIANYSGAVTATGIIFESSLDSGQPITIPLSQVIEGWVKGLPGMQPGGTRRLIIPAQMAYGQNPPPGSGIPANAALVFDISLIAAQ